MWVMPILLVYYIELMSYSDSKRRKDRIESKQQYLPNSHKYTKYESNISLHI